MAGLTLAEAGRAAGISKSETSRIERGESRRLGLGTLARLAAVVGLDLWIRAYPGAEPIRDSAQVGLGDAFQGLIGAPLAVRTEVRIGDHHDLRAWDLTLADPTGARCGVELESRFVDAQAQHRRISQKLADSDLEIVIVVVADTRANRAAVRAAASYLRPAYAIDDPATYAALRAGLVPTRSGLIFVAVPRRAGADSRPAGADHRAQPDGPAVSRGTGRSAMGSRGTGGSRK